MKTRLLGAAVLIALLVLVVPMFFPSHPPAAPGDQSVSLAIPPAPDRDLQTRTMSLNPDASAPAIPASTGATVIPAANNGSSDQLATVDIQSHRPTDVETGAAGAATAAQSTAGAATPAASQPVIPPQPPAPKADSVPPKNASGTPAGKPAPAPVPAASPAQAAHGSYMLNLSAYASSSGAASLVKKVRALGYPVRSHAIHQGGRTLTAVEAGPFPSRTAAESARLKITQTIAGVPAKLESSASTPAGDEPASAPAKARRAGGWAVQVAAMSGQSDAIALRDKLRANGFDGFVDSVVVGGKKLWRVRAGPQTQRDDALRVREQIKSKLGLSGNVVSVP